MMLAIRSMCWALLLGNGDLVEGSQSLDLVGGGIGYFYIELKGCI